MKSLLTAVTVQTVLLASCGGAPEMMPQDSASTTTTEVAAPEFAAPIAASQPNLMQLKADRGYPGLSVAVGVGNRIVWTATAGLSNVRARQMVTTASQFPIGSVSKTLSATVAMRLVEQQKIDLDLPIDRYVPSFPKKRYPISLRQLLSHQAGIRHYKIAPFQPGFSESNLNREFPSVTSSLELFRGDALKFEPDTKFLYSTFGYTLVAAAIEGATGRPFLEMMQKELFDPVKMSHTEPDTSRNPHPERTVDYDSPSKNGSVHKARTTNSSYKWAGGGFLSTPSDLATFGMALLGGRIVSAETRTLMFTPRKLRDGQENPQGYGLGFRVSVVPERANPKNLVTFVHHGGTAVGSEAAIVMMPATGVVVVISGNANTGGSEAMVRTASVIARQFADAQRIRQE